MVLRRIVGVLVLGCGLPFVALAKDGTPEDGEAQGERLRFRSGPPCTCAFGLDESAIAEASEKLKKAVAGAGGNDSRRNGNKPQRQHEEE